MAGHNDQQHAERHDDDERVLQHQVGDVDRLEQHAAGQELEQQHDDDERQKQAVFADVLPQVVADGNVGGFSAGFDSH
ncbi:hypothetical protein D3C72_1651330 [compost metagenome]